VQGRYKPRSARDTCGAEIIVTCSTLHLQELDGIVECQNILRENDTVQVTSNADGLRFSRVTNKGNRECMEECQEKHLSCPSLDCVKPSAIFCCFKDRETKYVAIDYTIEWWTFKLRLLG